MAYTSLSGRKLRSTLSTRINEASSAHSPALLPSHASFAKRHLEKMGWTEGTGLGKRRDGRTSHVKIRQREEEAGLGTERQEVKGVGDVWWVDSVGGTLARLKSKKDKKKKDKKKEKEATTTFKTFTDQELFEATGGARFGMRAQRRAEGKWRRTEDTEELRQWEEKAAAGMEWDGRGEARVVTVAENDGTSETKKRRRSNDDVHDDAKTNEEESERKRLKKLRKEKKKKSKEAHRVSPEVSEDDKAAADDDDAPVKKDKKKKKKKSSKN